MAGATIVFMDMVGFSKKSNVEQKLLVESLSDEVWHHLRAFLKPPLQTPEVLALPTGDGMALVFLHSATRRWSPPTIYHLLYVLQLWAWQQTTETTDVALRFGIHVGTVEIITDINGNPNVCGDTINYAQRVMDAANPRQVLLSAAAFREYIGMASATYQEPPFGPTTAVRLLGPLQVFAKHGLQLPVYNMVCEPPVPWWNNTDPVTAHFLLVSLSTLSRDITDSLAEGVQQAQALALVQLGDEQLFEALQNQTLILPSALRRFWVFMPDPETYASLNMGRLWIAPDMLRDSIAAWREYLETLQERSSMTQIKLALHRVPPLWGGLFVDWDRPGGRIHISPYLWNRATQDSPGYALHWLGDTPSEIYEAYVSTLDWLNNTVPNLLSETRLTPLAPVSP